MTMYAKSTVIVGTPDAGEYSLRKGMSFDDDHPLVAQRPDLFTSEPPEVDVAGPARRERWEEERAVRGEPVERGTAAPGERRGSPRR